MWKDIALILIGLVCGMVGGVSLTIALLKNLIGDDYEINKPKARGRNNKIVVEQTNKDQETNVKPKLIKKLINKFKRNGKEKK